MDLYRAHVLVCGKSGCEISNADNIIEAFNKQIKKHGLEKKAQVMKTDCFEFCEEGPICIVYPEGTYYSKVQPSMVETIVKEHLLNGRIVRDYLLEGAFEKDAIHSLDNIDFYKKQERIALKNCGIIDPESINEYIAYDGYKALGKVLTEMKPEEVTALIQESGLRGRGGGGFPTGKKWEFAGKVKGEQKYVVCNADEGDPGAFMDRSILEGDPHAVVESMTIAGYAIGADKGYVYVRAEYPIAVKRLQIAINQAKELGLLGENIFNSGFNFDLDIRLGAGAFVCGEETALLNSIEGKRGMPRPRPPFPAIKGLWGKPTLLSNVETYANVPKIILNGAEWFSNIGTKNSKGTKVFALTGKINNTGLIEIPMGTTLRDVIFEIGRGIPDGKKFKAVQTGGPSGGCITADHLDTEVDYDNFLELSSMMGSGGMVVMDEDNCMVDVAKFFLEFSIDESCGKCPPCRIGTKRMYEILEKITSGAGELEDIDRLEQLAYNIKESSLCGLGQSAPNPILSTLRFFRDEYETHINDKKCPAGVCQNLLEYTVVGDKCKKCGICANKCPVACIAGEKGKTIYEIDQDKCIKCGACLEACPFKAIVKA